MTFSEYANDDYSRPHVPPATPPVIAGAADAHDAATLANDNGDSDSTGSRLASFDRSAEDAQLFSSGGDTVEPGKQPDEVVPDRGDTDLPGNTPDEVAPGQGDFAEPMSTPEEMPAQPEMPMEAPAPD
ncbi:MAG: hypothetical protein ABIT09_12815 [Croceibacterium sp.]